MRKLKSDAGKWRGGTAPAQSEEGEDAGREDERGADHQNKVERELMSAAGRVEGEGEPSERGRRRRDEGGDHK